MAREIKEGFEHDEKSATPSDAPLKMVDGIVLIPQPSDDPRDPLNWSNVKKITTLAILSFGGCITLTQGLANQAGLFSQATLYHVQPVAVSYSLTAGLAGSVVGPFLWAPLSVYIGRSSVIFWTSLITTLCNVWSACMTDEDQYIAFVISRLFAGLFCTAPLTIGAGIILETFFLHQRGKAFACYAITAQLGAMLAPVTSGFIVQNVSWTVQFWWVVGAMGLVCILVFFFLDDTTFDRANLANNHPTRSYVSNRIATFFPGNRVVQGPRKSNVWTMCLLAVCPLILVTACSLILTFSWVVGLNTTLAVFLQTPVKFGGYGFSPSQNAEFVFAQWVAFGVAEVVGFTLNDRVAIWMCKRRGGIWKPEYRLWPVLIPPAISVPVGLILFGVALQYHLHYMVLATGFFLASYGDLSFAPVLNNYIAENFHDYAMETFSLLYIARILLGLAIPFFILPWIKRDGPAWVFGTMAILSSVGIGLVVILAWKGPVLRKYSFQRFIGTEEGETLVDVHTPADNENDKKD